MYVSLIYQGISPEDSERLLLRPMETKLKSLKGLKEMRSAAFQGGGYVLVEFQPSIDLATALQDTRSKVQDAKADLPQAAEEPTVTEVNISEFPVLVVTLSGNVPERVLTAAARELRDRIEEVPGVLEGTLQGARDDLVEVVVDPMKLSSYGLQLDQLIQGVGAIQQPGRGRQHRRLAGQVCRQGSVADRNAGGYRQPAGRRQRQLPWFRPRTWRRCARPSRTPKRSPGSTASRPSPSR